MNSKATEKPTPISVSPDAVPDDLRQRDAWVCWKLDYRSDRDEWTKVPIDATTGRIDDATDPDNWATFDAAVEYYERGDTHADGIGYVFHDSDMAVGIDLDDCRDVDTGELDPWAEEVVDEVDTYTEASPSGTGLHALGVGSMPDDNTRGDIDDADGHVEMYETGRFFTVTGATLADSPAEIREVNDGIESIYRRYIYDDDGGDPPNNPSVDTRTNGQTPTPNTGGTGSSDLDDSELVDIAKNAENGKYFTDLYEGRWQRHTHRWSDSSHSEARQAFANMLAFYTGGDERRMLNIFKNSDLCRGDDDLRTFENYEIPNATATVSEYYDPDSGSDTKPPTPNDPVDPGGDASSAVDLLTPDNVKAVASMGADGEISDLNDREKAACVWDLLTEGDEFHVRVRRDNASLWAFDGDVWNPDGERALRHAARRALGSMNYGENVLTELKAQARSDPRVEVEADEFGLPPGRVAVENGLLDLHAAAGDGDVAIRDLKPEDYALSQLPVRYDPDADSERWQQFVGEVVEPAKIDAVQEYVGYTLHRGAMPHAKALLLVGSGKNGKSTFLNVVRALLGEEQTTSKPVHKFDEENHVADLYGSVANIDADLSEGSLSSRGIAAFKRLTGGDSVDGRELYEDAFTFKSTAKHLYACNQVPDVSKYVGDHDIAFWRRWIVVEFPNYFTEEECDPNLERELTDPDTLSAVLNWAIDGWDRLHRNGEFTNADGHDDTRRRWQSWGESVEEFIAEHVERDPDAPRLSTGDAYKRYRAWCREVDADPVGRRRFTDTLKKEDVGYGRHRINGRSARGYDALGLSDEIPDSDADDDSDDDDETKQSGLT